MLAHKVSSRLQNSRLSVGHPCVNLLSVGQYAHAKTKKDHSLLPHSRDRVHNSLEVVASLGGDLCQNVGCPAV